MNYLLKKTDYLKEKPQEIFEKDVLPQRGNGWKSLKNGKPYQE